MRVLSRKLKISKFTKVCLKNWCTAVVGRKINKSVFASFKGSDQLCKVVELSMQCCGKLLSDSFKTD